jgi:hypothetical protein
LVGVEPEELADGLDGEDLAVRQRRLRAAPAQPPRPRQIAHEVIRQAENGCDERLEVHGGPHRNRRETPALPKGCTFIWIVAANETRTSG